MYSIIDIETTGLSPRREKITEIAIYVHDGKQVVDEFTTLLNPEIKIPLKIIQMTGINNRMVKDAPKFYEVAKHIVEMTENTTIVGHNVNFDYNFIRKEFRELGYDFKRDKICTAKLGRKLLPGRRSYSLGKLCTELGIKITHRHRAFGDASATVRLFEILLKVEKNLHDLMHKGLNTNLDRKLIDNLPGKHGVYYFYDERGEIIYIGKSNNIKERVMSHLTNNRSKRALEMREKIADIGYEITGSELIALLLESEEIKKHQPHYNKALRRKATQWGLYHQKDKNGYLNLKIARNDNENTPLTSFTTKISANSHLLTLVEAFNLCQKLCGLYETNGACFYHQIKQCKGACTGEEPSESYNERVKQAIEPYVMNHQDFLVLDKGRSESERAVVWVENGKFRGFGYVDYAVTDNLQKEILMESVKPYPDNKDNRHIVKSYIKNNSGCRVINL
ncbi:MAG: GIY-YIG nuclease family protein [Bacteroidales bacterium]|nr:GIY-YIG nuclease family protein [Bacteroidales bacterium]